jgi:hypothetical protein
VIEKLTMMAFLGVMWLFAFAETSQQIQSQSLHAADPITIVMSTGNGMWNTGVWTGYGEGPITQLRWAASGISVDKTSCKAKTPCIVSQDQSKIAEADAVLMETVNHPKFGMGSRPFPFIDKRTRSGKRRLMGMFYYEPSIWYPDYTTNSEVHVCCVWLLLGSFLANNLFVCLFL